MEKVQNAKPYEEFLGVMKQLHKDPKVVYVGTMTGNNSCTLDNGLPLYGDDLLISDMLRNGWVQSSDGGTVVKQRGLSAGDKVIVLKVDDDNFAIVARV